MKPNGYWELRIFHEVPSFWKAGNGLGAADVDGDGQVEVVTGGTGGLFWYRPQTDESGVIWEGGVFLPELRLEDMDGDGVLEVLTGCLDEGRSLLLWLKPDGDLSRRWRRYVIDPNGGGHDVLRVDIDGDGIAEVVAHNGRRGTALYKPGTDITAPWQRFDINTAVFREGLAAADFDGDGRMEILHGPDLFFPPKGGPYAGPWRRQTFAPNFREMNRVALVDITGNGRPDVVIAESEYMEGRLSWFENRMAEDPGHPWVERPMETPLIYAHSLDAWRDGNTVRVFVAEMEKGGWNAPYNFHARLIHYATADAGKSWTRDVMAQGAGTHQAIPYDLDRDGELEIVGKECCQLDLLGQPKVQIWKRRAERPPLARFRHSFVDRDKPETATDIL
ncbi:MAG: VCBS repeat-containing protein, partial [Armatimonadota bacterium]|nr:VCBS repeat-containing protein [Armatimonadota bacterium]